MEKVLNYKFKRRTNNHYEWLYEVVKSEKFYQAESLILSKDTSSELFI